MKMRMPDNRRVGSVLFVSVSLLIAASCALPGFGEASQGERSLRVLPRFVVYDQEPGGAATSVRLEVVVADAYGNPEEPAPLTWSSSVPGVTFTASGNSALVVIPPALPAGSAVQISATDGMLSGTSSFLVSGEPAIDDDRVSSERLANDPPPIVLSSGLIVSSCSSDRVMAFVGTASIGRLIGSTACNRAEALVFSASRRPHIVRPAPWTATQDVIDATVAPARIALPVNLVIGVPEADAFTAESSMNFYLLVASDIYHNMRAGVAFPTALQTTTRQVLPTSIDRCDRLSLLPENVAPVSDKVNVYFVAHLENDLRGVFCEPNVILLSFTSAVSTSFAHEASHLLGLIAQDFGHTDTVFGFQRDNVMSGYTGTGSGEDMRFRLTLGQVYRMHVDSRSWIRRAADVAPGQFICPCDPNSEALCPVLWRDVAPVSGTPTPYSGTCS